MYEKCIEHAPSIIPLLVIGLAVHLYLITIKTILKDELGSTDWCSKKKNIYFFYFVISSPERLLGAPVIEELLWRLPLIIAFDKITPEANVWIWFSAITFGVAHWSNPKRIVTVSQLESGERTFLPKTLTKNEHVKDGNKRASIGHTAFAVTFATLLGAVLGYIGVGYQSIWIAVALHALWNLVGPTLLFISFLFSLFFVSMITHLYSVISKKISLFCAVRWLQLRKSLS